MNYQVFDAKVLSKSLGRMLPMNYQVLTLFNALGDFGAFFLAISNKISIIKCHVQYL